MEAVVSHFQGDVQYAKKYRFVYLTASQIRFRDKDNTLIHLILKTSLNDHHQKIETFNVLHEVSSSSYLRAWERHCIMVERSMLLLADAYVICNVYTTVNTTVVSKIMTYKNSNCSMITLL